MIAPPNNTALILSVKEKTLFTKLEFLYPECVSLIEGHGNLHPLICLKSSCPRNQRCMERLVKRVKFVFDSFPGAELLILYFKYYDRPGSLRGGVFWKDFREPRVITMNPSAWEKLKSVGDKYELELPLELLLA